MTSSGILVIIVTCIFFCLVKTASVTLPLTKIAMALYSAYCQPNRMPAANYDGNIEKNRDGPDGFPRTFPDRDTYKIEAARVKVRFLAHNQYRLR